MKRAVYIFLFVMVLLLPFVFRRVVGGQASRVVGGKRLVVITPNNQDIRQEFAWAFSEWHLKHYGVAVSIDYRVPGGAADIKRQLELSYKGRMGGENFKADYDVLWGGGDYFFDQELKPLGVFQPLGVSKELLKDVFPEEKLAGVRLYDSGKEPEWVGVAVSGFGIVYNPDLYETLGLAGPRGWGDLTDAKLAGFVSLADPTHSGSVAIAYMMVMQHAMAEAEKDYFGKHPGGTKKEAGYREAIAGGWKKGMGELVLMAANTRYFTASATEVPNQVGDGEAAAGVAIDLYARVYAETVGDRRARFVLPAGATAVTPDPVGILAGVKGERLELARHFVEFLLSKEGQRLWALKVGEVGGPRLRALRRSPIRRDVYADRTGWSDDVDPFAEAGGFNQRAEWMGEFGDLRSVWHAAWIDAREELHRAYGAVLAVKDGGRRSALINELADLPIDMAEVDGIRGKRKLAADVEEWKVRQQMEWTERFREHYRKVEAEARQ